ncbi:hypothetical protein ACLB2K_010226 [Fragaria x ananassa]
MDKTWVRLHPLSPEFKDALLGFLNHAIEVASFDGTIKCPCINCKNQLWQTMEVVEEHLSVDGMLDTYLKEPWVWHGETFEAWVEGNEQGLQEATTEDPPFHTDGGIETMLDDLYPGVRDTTEDPPNGNVPPPLPPDDVRRFYELLEETNKEIYPGCQKMMKMEFLVKLVEHKCKYGISEVALNSILLLIKCILPKGETLPENFGHAKTLVSKFGLKYEKIHACPNDCILYRGDYHNLQKCPTCNEERYQPDDGTRKKPIPHKVLRYFPLAPRLKRLYMSRHTAEDMRWHATERQNDGHLRHPADSRAWKHLDTKFPNFGGEMRNVRLGLATDGFNPFGNMSTSHSTWPVLLTVYNLPPWLCMKQPFIFISLLISGPESPGNDIDVFLQPLIDELKDLWDNGIDTYDAFRQETFRMRAAVIWTINDFPAYANLSGWSTKGYLACPVCNYDTESERLDNCKKIVFMGNRRFLPMDHFFRHHTVSFNLCTEFRAPPVPLTGAECLACFSTLNFTYGKPRPPKVGEKRPRAPPQADSPWKKISIFLKLPYWEHLLIRHNIDVMHVQKNVFDSVVGTLLGIPGKSKDSLNARLDMKKMKIKEKLWPAESGPLPMGAYSILNREKELFCKVLAVAILPDGLASNIARKVHVKERTIHSLKSHDCHIIMQQLLPLAVRNALPPAATILMLELSRFFRHLSSKKGTEESFHKLTTKITLILCQMERMFPPSMFDVMVHVMIHLAEEAALAGPVQLRWMFPIERYLHTLKEYVRNRNRPEGSIAQGYIIDECLSFCAMYLGDTDTSRSRPKRNCDGVYREVEGGLDCFRGGGRSLGAAEDFLLDNKDWELARSYVLTNTHVSNLEQRKFVANAQKNKGRKVNGLKLQGDPSATEDLVALANGPSKLCKRFKKYVSNGFRFKVRGTGQPGKTQNWGVFIQAEQTSYASTNDQNPKDGMVDFYGALLDVYEFTYNPDRKVVLFQCDWIDSLRKGRGLQRDEYGFTLVRFDKCIPIYRDPFIFASQALQVFYVEDPEDPPWHVAVKTQPRDLFDVSSTNEYDPCDEQDIQYATGDTDEVPMRSDV